MHRTKSLVALSALGSLIFPEEAKAEEFTVGGGGYLSFTFGKETPPALGWGIEVFGAKDSRCVGAPRTIVQPILQFGMLGFRAPRLVAALYGGRELGSRSGQFALGGEIGATYRWGDDPGFGVHTAVVPSFSILSGFIKAEWLLDEYSIGGGVRIPPLFGFPATCIPGRPLRTADGLAPLPEALWEEESRVRDRKWDALLARAWARDAQAECASVPAFVQLALELLAVDAPQHLIETALRAARQEINHARMCAGIASSYAGRGITPVLPRALGRAPLPREAALLRLAVESWVDGCLGEGTSARQAEHAYRRALDPKVRRAQQQIARDEAEHAELAWRILTWTLRCGGEAVRHAVQELREHRVLPSAGIQDDFPREWAALGRVHPECVAEIGERHAERCRARLDGLLSRSSRARLAA